MTVLSFVIRELITPVLITVNHTGVITCDAGLVPESERRSRPASYSTCTSSVVRYKCSVSLNFFPVPCYLAPAYVPDCVVWKVELSVQSFSIGLGLVSDNEQPKQCTEKAWFGYCTCKSGNLCCWLCFEVAISNGMEQLCQILRCVRSEYKVGFPKWVWFKVEQVIPCV